MHVHVLVVYNIYRVTVNLLLACFYLRKIIKLSMSWTLAQIIVKISCSLCLHVSRKTSGEVVAYSHSQVSGTRYSIHVCVGSSSGVDSPYHVLYWVWVERTPVRNLHYVLDKAKLPSTNSRGPNVLIYVHVYSYICILYMYFRSESL